MTPFRRSASAVLFMSASALGGCATTSAKPPTIAYDNPPAEIAATLAPEAPKPVEVVTIPEPLPLPGQLKPAPAEHASPPEPADPRQRVGVANAAARMQPVRDGFLNAIQQYPWTEGALYQVYATPGQVTDIALQPGEQLVGAGPVAAGDTVRWIIGDTTSGSGSSARVHVLVKPIRPDLSTNLVINTDRRTYHMELRATRRRPPPRRLPPVWMLPRSISATASMATMPRGSRCAPSMMAVRSISSFRRGSRRARCRRYS